ncbi:MAG: hypothetical protein JJE25_03655 [Bacteroidia bacterium]|nr:hypothetical protein [Bacteroidia bacterium]
MKKFVVKLELSKKSVLQKIDSGKSVVLAMTANPNFTTPVPPLVDITAVTLALEKASNDVEAQGGGTLLTAIMHEKENDFDTKMTALGNYVDGVAMGSETIILSAGMETKKQNAPIGIPAEVTGLEAKGGPLTGEISLRWKSVKGAKTYVIYTTEDINSTASFRIIGHSTRAKFSAENLTSGNLYWFKVEAIGSAGTGHASDPAMAHAAF